MFGRPQGKLIPPQGGSGTANQSDRQQAGTVIRSSPYYHRIEVDDQVIEVGFATYQEMLDYLGRKGTLPPKAP